jgi:hypothetical protein
MSSRIHQEILEVTSKSGRVVLGKKRWVTMAWTEAEPGRADKSDSALWQDSLPVLSSTPITTTYVYL